jgi:hypothetical protein
MKASHTPLKLAHALIAACLIAASASASATDLPTQKLAGLQCSADAAESCCEKWVDTVVTAARTETNPASMLNTLPRRIERWRLVEKRSFCAIKKDIETRDLPIQNPAKNPASPAQKLAAR